jgi:CBS domain-containing protein
MIVGEVMTRDPYAARAAASVRQVLRMLAEADVRHIPIVDDGGLVGIVSDRDLRHVMPGVLEEFENPPEAQRALSQPITSVMSSDVVSVNPESDLGEAVDLMLELKIGAIPVVEPDSTKLVGIVSYVDALRAAREFL